MEGMRPTGGLHVRCGGSAHQLAPTRSERGARLGVVSPVRSVSSRRVRIAKTQGGARVAQETMRVP